MIKDGNIYYRCLVDMQPVLSSEKLGDMMRVVEYEEQHSDGKGTSELAVVECRMGKKGCRPVKTIPVSESWGIPSQFFELMDFGAKRVGRFGVLGDWYKQKTKV